MFNLSKFTLGKDNLLVEIEDFKNYYKEVIKISDGDTIIPILGSVKNQSTLNLWAVKRSLSRTVKFRKKTKKKLYFFFENDEFSLNLDYCLEEDNILHIRYKMSNKVKLDLSKLLVTYSIFLGNKPDYTWVPHICPKIGYVIGDHVFRSPVIIYKKGKYGFVFIPDLKTLGNNHPFQTFLDFNLKGNEFNREPYVSYGFGNYRPVKHYLFKHNKNKKWVVEPNTDLTFRYYIIVFKGKSISQILQFVNRFLWEKYGRKLYYNSLNPQIIPFSFNVREGFKALFDRHKFWGNFTINDEDCGGYWLRTWIGAEKSPIKFFHPKHLKDYNIHDTIRQRVAIVWNNAWFLNIRSAYGIRYFGEDWEDKDLINKSNRMFNTILNLPRTNGIFPSLILPASYESSKYSLINGTKAFFHTEDFHLVDASLAMYWALKFYQNYGHIDERIVERSKELAILIIKLQLENGAIPTLINLEHDKNNPIIRKDLLDSASSGASLMFLLEYYRVSKDNSVISPCIRIAEYIQKEVIPQDKWHDFEAFYSCTYPIHSEYDEFTASHIINTLSIYWSAEGFKELFRITKKEKYLIGGERILAVLSLFQQIWDMPYISYNTFGGFGVQNADAELSDARQALFVRTYMDYYLETGKGEYMERGIAALRASWTLQLLKEYEHICPGNLQGISTINGVDRGCVFENYGHNGRDQRILGYIMFDWGLGTAAMATAYAKQHFGDLFIDFKEEFVFGIDGVLLKRFEFIDNSVILELTILNTIEKIIIKAREVPFDLVELIFNKKSLGKFKKDDLEKGFIKYIVDV